MSLLSRGCFIVSTRGDDRLLFWLVCLMDRTFDWIDYGPPQKRNELRFDQGVGIESFEIEGSASTGSADVCMMVLMSVDSRSSGTRRKS